MIGEAKLDGALIINKPKGRTSFDMIREVRKKYNTKKVGHIGTLDPLASGVLPVLVGKATKLSDYLMEHDKEYIATLKLGTQTDTGDLEGSAIKTMNVPKNIYENDNIQNVLSLFKNESTQIPPMYSAIKIDGKKLYELARKGETVERKPRKIYIYDIEIKKINLQKNEITFRTVCSKGTYIRTLCEDIASKLGTCGHMTELLRTRVGKFKIEDESTFIELKDLLKDVPQINAVDLEKLENGMSLPTPADLSNYQGLANLFYDDKFIGICKANNGYYKRFIM